MDFTYTRGQRLVIELSNNEIIEGDFESGTKHRIDVVNVKESPKGTNIKGLLSYYCTEISSIRVLSQENEVSEETSKNETQEALPVTAITMHRNEFERLEEMTRNYTYMATMDNRYLSATSHLSNCETVGVVAIGAELGRLKPISLLVLSSWDQVYIFDIISFNQKTFPPELQKILENNSIVKVIHDVRSVSDCLGHCHKVTLKNVFDTQVADMMLLTNQHGTAPQTSRSLSDCLVHYFNFPSSVLEETKNVKAKDWERRPLDSTLKMLASLRATYLIVVKCKFEKIMLKNYYAVVAAYAGILRDADSYTAQRNVCNDNVPEDIQDLLNTHRERLSNSS